MSFIVCPLCGKQTSLRTFDPTNLDLDIYIQEVKGLGRGKGFEVVGRRSALNIPEVEDIKERVLDIIIMLYKKGVISKKELSERFSFLLKGIRDERDALEADVSEMEDKLKEAEARIDKCSQKSRNFVDLIADALDDDSEQWLDYVYEKMEHDEEVYLGQLEIGIHNLIDEYLAYRASEEEEEKEKEEEGDEKNNLWFTDT